jgi:hypothetical protein
LKSFSAGQFSYGCFPDEEFHATIGFEWIRRMMTGAPFLAIGHTDTDEFKRVFAE